jgi:hypothetical protein
MEAPRDFYTGMLLEFLVLHDPRFASLFERHRADGVLMALKRLEPCSLFVKTLSALARVDADSFSSAWNDWADERAARRGHDHLETGVSYEALSVLPFSMALGFPQPRLSEDTPLTLVRTLSQWCWPS